MEITDALKARTPEPLKKVIRSIRCQFVKKNGGELSYWRSKFETENGQFKNSHYKRLMLGMASEQADDFVKGKIVADFGCGPRGSLTWASSALLRIGIDVIADQYADEFTHNITSHGMIYLKCTEKVIPLPSDFVDIMFTINAMDHVDNFPTMCKEIVRVLKPGGEFIGSFNLDEPATPCEPQQLSERIVKEALLSKLQVRSYRVANHGPNGIGAEGQDLRYQPFFDGNLSYTPGEEGYLWVRAQKLDRRCGS